MNTVEEYLRIVLVVAIILFTFCIFVTGMVNTFETNERFITWYIDYSFDEEIYTVKLDRYLVVDLPVFKSADIDSCKAFGEALMYEQDPKKVTK